MNHPLEEEYLEARIAITRRVEGLAKTQDPLWSAVLSLMEAEAYLDAAAHHLKLVDQTTLSKARRLLLGAAAKRIPESLADIHAADMGLQEAHITAVGAVGSLGFKRTP